MNRSTILNYHIVYEERSPIAMMKDEFIYANGLQEFQRHIKHIYDSKCNVTSLEHYIVRSFNKEGSFVITFDDGHFSAYSYAMPVLKDYGFTAVFFIVVKNIGLQGYLTWQQIREMADNGMSIGSHTMTHRLLNDLSPKEIYWELQESKNILEHELGKPVEFLSLPGGRCNKIVKKIAEEVGYKGICTSIVGYNYPNTDPYSLRRWTITRNMRFSTFQAIVEGKKSTLAYYKSRQALLNGMKKMMGNKLYANIHREITAGIKSNTK